MFFESDYKVLTNEKIAKDVYKMELEGDTSHITAPGQFINIKLEGKFLRRPISVCDCNENVITIIYKVVGEGTEQMSNISVGEILNILTGLGNGYDISKSAKPLLIGGGVGGVLLEVAGNGEDGVAHADFSHAVRAAGGSGLAGGVGHRRLLSISCCGHLEGCV